MQQVAGKLPRAPGLSEGRRRRAAGTCTRFLGALHSSASAERAWDCQVWTETWKSPGKSGKQVSTKSPPVKATLVAPYRDGDGSLRAVAANDSGATTFALLPPTVDDCGWSASCKNPGATLELPVNSLQKTGAVALTFDGDPTGKWLAVGTDVGIAMVQAGDGHGTCVEGTCFILGRAIRRATSA